MKMRNGTLINRRDVVLGGATGLALAALRTTTAVGLDANAAIGGVRVGAPMRIPNNEGDTWAVAWADDDNLYSPVNDGLGFANIGDALAIFSPQQVRLIESDSTASEKFTKERQREAIKDFGITPAQLEQVAAFEKKTLEWKQRNLGKADAHVGFNRIVGDHPFSLTGVNINVFRDLNTQDRGKSLPLAPGSFEVGPDGRTWKSGGCSFIDGALYLAISRHDYGDPFGRRLRQDAINASFIRSVDYGNTWTRSARANFNSPMFPGSDFATPYFVDYGQTQPKVHGADRYVYAISNNGFWDNGDTLILGRVLRLKLAELNGSQWEFYTGSDGLRAANWSANPAHAVPLVRDPSKLGETGAVYLPARGRYMMVNWYYPDGTGHAEGAAHKTIWNFHEAPCPWGPWTQIGSHTWFPQGYYCPGICPKFQSSSRVYVMTAGDFTNGLPYYHLTVVPLDLG